MRPEAASRANGEDPEEARLRALYAAAYVPVKPSAALKRRVAGLMAPDEARMPSRCTVHRARPIGWVPAATLAAVTLLAVLGLMRARASRDGARRYGLPHVATRPAPASDSTLPSPDPQPHRSGHDPTAAQSPAPSIPHAEETALPVPRSRGAGRGRTAALNPIFRAGTQRPLRAVDDLTALNDVAATAGSRWELDARRDRIEARLRRAVPVRDDFVRIPFPRHASASDRQIAEAVESYQREAVIVDGRLTRAVTLQQKAMPLSDLCERLRGDTGVQLTAGASVADEKVTIFCEKMPLRDVMRQLSRPFGYAWLRAGKAPEYRYELVQDLRSQLLEEELRNRDRNEALLALDQQMQRFRPYLDLSPDQALARARTAAPEEKKLLDQLAGLGWGVAQLYLRLSTGQLAVLRAGQPVIFSPSSELGQQPLPPDVARGVLQSWRDYTIVRDNNGQFEILERNPALPPGSDYRVPQGLPPAAVPQARPVVALRLAQSDLGELTLAGGVGLTVGGSIRRLLAQWQAAAAAYGGASAFGSGDMSASMPNLPLAVGTGTAIQDPRNGAANARFARDPDLGSRVSIAPQPSCPPAGDLSPSPSPKRGRVPVSGNGLPRPEGSSSHHDQRKEKFPLPASGRGSGGEVPLAKVTSADALEAFHRASGLPLVADYYTRLYPPQTLTLHNLPIFEALNRLADAMQMHWHKERGWLQFRSVAYFHDRLKEVPHRSLSRWSVSREKNGALTLDDLVEIAQLTEPQLNAESMAEGARICFGLREWNLARKSHLRPHLRYLAGLSPAQRVAAVSARGLEFTQLSLAQQQQFIAFALDADLDPERVRREDLSRGTLGVTYTVPGGLEWTAPEELGGAPRFAPRAPSLPATTQQARDDATHRFEPRVDQAESLDAFPALDLRFTYRLGGTPGRGVRRWITSEGSGLQWAR